MMRDEALKKLKSCNRGLCISDKSMEASLDGYVALGMLKLDEPKSIEMRFFDAFNNLKPGFRLAANLLGAIDAAGLKVVEK